jgi:hypothetical protein
MAVAGRGSNEAKYNIGFLDEMQAKNFPPSGFFFLSSLGLFIRHAKNMPLPWWEGIEGRGCFFNRLRDGRGKSGASPNPQRKRFEAKGRFP